MIRLKGYKMAKKLNKRQELILDHIAKGDSAFSVADILAFFEKEEEKSEEPLRHRPYVVRGSTYRLSTPVGTAFITINEDEEGQPLEVFINVGKAGSDVAAMAEALGRTISTTLKFRGNISAKEKAREIAEQLAGIGGRRSIGFGPTKIRSLPDAIAGAISVHYNFGINGYHNSPNIFGGNQRVRRCAGKEKGSLTFNKKGKGRIC